MSSVSLLVEEMIWSLTYNWHIDLRATVGCWKVNADTVTFERKSKVTLSLDCIMIDFLPKMSSFSINASVSIQVPQPYINIGIHFALNRRILKLSLIFSGLILIANAGHASLIRTKQPVLSIQRRIPGTLRRRICWLDGHLNAFALSCYD